MNDSWFHYNSDCGHESNTDIAAKKGMSANETKRESKSICSTKRADQADTASNRRDEQSADYALSAAATIWSIEKTNR